MPDQQIKIFHKLAHDLSGLMIHQACQDETRIIYDTSMVIEL